MKALAPLVEAHSAGSDLLLLLGCAIRDEAARLALSWYRAQVLKAWRTTDSHYLWYRPRRTVSLDERMSSTVTLANLTKLWASFDCVSGVNVPVVLVLDLRPCIVDGAFPRRIVFRCCISRWLELVSGGIHKLHRPA